MTLHTVVFLREYFDESGPFTRLILTDVVHIYKSQEILDAEMLLRMTVQRSLTLLLLFSNHKSLSVNILFRYVPLDLTQRWKMFRREKSRSQNGGYFTPST